MASCTNKKALLTFILIGLLAALLPKTISGQNNASVANIVTQDFFNMIINQADSNCEGKGFYSRDSFLKALSSYPQFGTTGTENDKKREIAAYFAHVTYITVNFCYINEVNGASMEFCDRSSKYTCVPGKSYYGRGPIQLTWNFNYGPAGQSIGFDGLGAPETVGSDPVVSFKTGFWFWMNNCHSIMTSGQGFGATIRAFNGIECDGRNTPSVRAKVGFYTKYCNQFGVSPGDNLYC